MWQIGISSCKFVSVSIPISTAGLLYLQGPLDKRKEKHKVENYHCVSFCPFSLNVNIMYFHFIKELVCWKQAEKWHLGFMGTNRPQFDTGSFALAILVKPDRSRIFLWPQPAVKLEKSRTVDLRNICVSKPGSREALYSVLMVVLLNNH